MLYWNLTILYILIFILFCSEVLLTSYSLLNVFYFFFSQRSLADMCNRMFHACTLLKKQKQKNTSVRLTGLYELSEFTTLGYTWNEHNKPTQTIDHPLRRNQDRSGQKRRIKAPDVNGCKWKGLQSSLSRNNNILCVLSHIMSAFIYLAVYKLN